uniref:Additional component NikL of nickel ECF transporter n=1 Tax=Nitratidesulfovibrio vulgaris (strain DSM 19637 / Miyazaki F) TaxID=883 RepID=B8DP18_NITV9
MPSKQTRIFARTPLCGSAFADTTARSTTTAGAYSTSAAPDALGMPSQAITRRVITRTGHHAAALFTILLAGAILLLGQASPALAHRVNIFAWVEGGAIRCESSFSSGNPTREAKVTARLAGSNTVMGTAVTDAKGRCALPITSELRAAKADLVIEVQAGEGHRNTWTMPAEEYLAAPVVESAAATPADPAPPAASSAAPQAASDIAPAQNAPRAAVPSPSAAGPSAGAAIDEVALRRIVAEAVAEQVAPLRHSLAAMQSGGPRMSDVAGGIGYIVGLAGIALWARSRRR